MPTPDGASLIRDDASGDAEQPEPSPGVRNVISAPPRNREDLGCDVVGIGSRVTAPTGESPQVVEVSVEQSTKQFGI